ncbi:MAG: tetratricopeptide repeat protein, partial [Cyanobacteria bacterium J06627_32]
DFAQAQDYFDTQRQIAREIGDRNGESQALGALGNVCTALGQHAKALDYHQQHLAIAQAIGNQRSASHALSNLAKTYAALNDPTQSN